MAVLEGCSGKSPRRCLTHSLPCGIYSATITTDGKAPAAQQLPPVAVSVGATGAYHMAIALRKINSLSTLAHKANEAHRAAEENASNAVSQAAVCGGYLAQAKEQLHHGDWQPWIEENFEGSRRTAQVYMQIAERKPELAEGAKAQHAAHLSIRDALKQLTPAKGSTEALQSSESNEWYTPLEYVESARKLMGGIDLDPASCEVANRVVRAKKYYTEKDDGLAKLWKGRIWLNPPYGRGDRNESNQEIWSGKLIEQHRSKSVREAVLLVNAVTDRAWFQPLWGYPLCFVEKRISFYTETGVGAQPTHGSAFVYFGSKAKAFVNLYSEFGRCVVPRGRFGEVV